MKKLIILIIVFYSGLLHAQDGWKDLEKLRNTYAELNSLSCNIQVVIDYFNTNNPTQSYNGVVKKSGNCYYSELMNIINLVNLKYHVTINKTNKYIQIGSAKKETNTPGYYNVKGMLDSLTKINYLLSTDKRNGSEVVYLLTPKAPQAIAKIFITISLPDYQMKKVVYQYSEDQSDLKKVEITYSNILFNKPVPTSDFSESPFVTVSGNKAIPTAAYKNYKIFYN